MAVERIETVIGSLRRDETCRRARQVLETMEF